MKKIPLFITLSALTFAGLSGCGCHQSQPVVSYTVSFKNYDGSLLSESKVNSGETVIYNGITPTRGDTSEYTYNFKGWDQPLENITSDCVRVAQYDEVLKPVAVYYTVSFKNWDGTLLYEDVVEPGETATYDKENDPTRPETDAYSYTFNGWDGPLTNITSDCTRIAQFIETAKPVAIYYTVSFKNWDGTLLYEDVVEPGETATYDKENDPTRPETDAYSYTFNGWDGPLTNITSDCTRIAQFTETAKPVTKYFTVTFKNWDGSTLSQSLVAEGEDATYGGTTPIRPATSKYTYAFTGWDGSLKEIYADCVRTAQFSQTNIEYTVRFYSYDNQLLYTDTVHYQEGASYYGLEPTKPSSETHTYTFSGWDKDISSITKSIDVHPLFDVVGKTTQITLKPNNGESDQHIDVTFDEAYDLGAPINPGLAFAGWYSGETLIPNSGTWTYTGVSTISARWESGNFNFALNDDGHSYTVSLTTEGAKASEIIIPSSFNDIPVTALAANFAKQNENIQTLTVPSTVKAIPEYAFYKCTNLREVNLSNGLLSIGQYAFHTTKIQKMIIPSTCTSIGGFAFDYCGELYHVYIPISVASVGSYAFDGMHSTGYVCIEHNSSTPAGWQSNWTENVVYYQATKLVETDDYNYVIRSDYGDYNVAIIRLGEETSKKQNFTFPSEIEGITDIRVGYQLFYKNLYIRNVTFTNVTRIGNMAFTYCENLQTITFTNSLTYIGKSAFRYCYALTRVEIPDSVTEIAEFAFDTCHALEYAFIPTSVVTIGSYAFDDCDLLTIYTTNHAAKSGWNNTWNGAPTRPTYYDFVHTSDTEDFNYVVQSYMGEDYVTITGMKASAKLKKNIVIPDEIEGISDIRLIKELFKGFSELVSIDLGTGVKKIPESCFYNIDKLETVILHEGVTSIDSTAFYSCDALTSINMPSTLTSIGKQAFDYCYSLKEIVIPLSVTYIGSYAFDDSGILAILIEASTAQSGWQSNWYGPSGNKRYIYDYVSSGTIDGLRYAKAYNGVTNTIFILGLTDTNVTSIVVPDEIEGITNIKIASYAFYNNTILKTVDLGNSVTSIGGYAFGAIYNYSGNISLTSVIIPDTCTVIKNYAFANCPQTCVLNCMADSLPSTWESNWNHNSCQVVWGYTR